MAASLNNLDSVISHFKDMNCPFFIISEDKKNIFYANSLIADIDEAADKLREKLEDKDHTKPFHIYCFDKVTKGGLSINTKTSAIYFSYQKQRPEMPAYYGGESRAIFEMIRKQDEQMSELRQIILANQSLPEEEEEDPINMQSNVVGAILGHPAIQSILTALLTNVAANLITPNNSLNNNQTNQNYMNIKPTALAGTEEQQGELLAATLEKIFAKGVTLEHLIKISEMPDFKIKGLLMML